MNAVLQVQSAVSRSATVTLGRNGLHSLGFNTRAGTIALWRHQVEALNDAIAMVERLRAFIDIDDLLFSLFVAMRPELLREDVPALRRAIDEFLDEMAFEDRRGEPRSHSHTKLLRI